MLHKKPLKGKYFFRKFGCVAQISFSLCISPFPVFCYRAYYGERLLWIKQSNPLYNWNYGRPLRSHPIICDVSCVPLTSPIRGTQKKKLKTRQTPASFFINNFQHYSAYNTGTIPVLVVLLLLLTLGLIVAGHNYNDALRKSILFFEGQRSKKLPPN